jgi:hypothetical protein
MPTVQLEAELTAEQLLTAAEQLDPVALDQFVARLVALRARRQAPSLPSAEAELLVRINRGLPEELRRRYDALIARRRAEALAPEEQEELLTLTGQVEALETERVAALADLARLRKVSLAALMKDLGIPAPAYE